MKKNLILLYSVYFFVIQPLVVGIIWGQENFFRLSAINLIAIVLIGILYNTIEWKSDTKSEEVPQHEKKSSKESSVSFHEHIHAVIKERKKKSELRFVAVVCLMITIALFWIFSASFANLAIVALDSILIGFVLFIILTRIYRHRFTKRFWALIGTKIYILLIVGGLGWIGLDYAQIYKDYHASFQDYVAQNIFGEERIPTDGYVFTWEGTVLWSGLWNTHLEEETASDFFSGMVDTIVQEDTTTTTQPEDTGTITKTVGKQTLMDAVVYLMNSYKIPLVTTKDISFRYVTSKNPYYNEWRTAYANKLIGSSTNPTKYIVCESYIVMKWLLEKWPVTYTASTVLNKFRAEATKRNVLNGCEKWKIVTDQNL